MATLHKIVLAIASSWNNGTSSPAPQGNNRALSNEPNALASAIAERQAQPSAKTPPFLNPISKGIGKFWIPILLVIATVLTAFLTPNDAQAQRQAIPDPDYEVYGRDKYTYEMEINGQWHRETYQSNTIYHPNDRRKEYAYHFYVVPAQHVNPRSKMQTIKMRQGTRWFKDGIWKNRFNYGVFTDHPNPPFKRSFGHKYPARFKSGKVWAVGTDQILNTPLFRMHTRQTWTHRTKVALTATHTTGGKVTFLATIKYRVDDSDTDTTIQTPIELAPGETTSMTLSVPDGGTYADIKSIDVTANRPPNPPSTQRSPQRASPDDLTGRLIPPDVYFGPGIPSVPRTPKKKPTPPVNQN